MRFPENLKKGGTIGFVAPSFGCTTEPYKSAFANAQKKWKEMGYQLDLGPNCYAEHGIGISAARSRFSMSKSSAASAGCADSSSTRADIFPQALPCRSRKYFSKAF